MHISAYQPYFLQRLTLPKNVDFIYALPSHLQPLAYYRQNLMRDELGLLDRAVPAVNELFAK